jgi:DNA-directed RNA polymerase specialized sigma24 family protein
LKNYKQEIAAHWLLINRIAERRFIDTNCAEEAALYVINLLEEDDCRRLRTFSGRAKFSTFISSLTIRLLEDFSRKKFGRVRPPAWITALGGIWVTLFQLLCLQRLSVVDAIETMKNRVAGSKQQQVEETAWTILEEMTSCGKHQGLEVPFDNVDDGQANDQDTIIGHHDSPEVHLLKNERRILFELIFKGVTKTEDVQSSAERSFITILKTPIQMSAKERLLLKLCFQDQLSVTRAGKMLGWNANQSHGKLRRLLVRLRDKFDRAGIGDELRGMLHEN